MELLLILTYAAFCIGVFKLFRIPLNKWTVPTAVLGGVVIIGALVVVMNYNHPYSEVSRSYFATVPIVPEVSGQVIEVYAEPNQVLEKDAVLLKLDPTPFAAEVAALEAQLESATADFRRAQELISSNSISQRDFDQAQTLVNELTPQLAAARWKLDNTVVRAPSRGFVTQVAVRPGIMAVSLPLKPVMVFVPVDSLKLAAWFRQNSLLRLEPGYEAEVIFDALPGKIFTAQVQQVAPALAEGQVPATGTLFDGASLANRVPGRVSVVLKITDPDFAAYSDRLPRGAFGQAAVYSEHAHHLAVMRKILLRMSSWMSYIYPFH